MQQSIGIKFDSKEIRRRVLMFATKCISNRIEQRRERLAHLQKVHAVRTAPNVCPGLSTAFNQQQRICNTPQCIVCGIGVRSPQLLSGIKQHSEVLTARASGKSLGQVRHTNFLT